MYLYSVRNLDVSIRFSLKSRPSERFPRPEMSQIKAEISLHTNLKLIFHKNHRELWISPNATSKNRLPLIAFGPFRFINVTYKSTRQIQLSQFWIFCNFFGYFVHWSYITIFRIKLCKNLNAKFEITLRFFIWNYESCQQNS